MIKKNCWEYKGCGRVPGGLNVLKHGICPAYNAKEFDACNSGTNAGRMCWKIAGTFCGSQVQGTFAQKLSTCLNCKFLQKVMQEEGDHFRFL